MEFNINENNRVALKGLSFSINNDEHGHRFPMYIISNGKFLYYPGFVTHRDNRPDYQIIYTHTGRGRMVVDDVTQPLLPGSIVMIDCSHLHEFEADCPEGWLYSYAHISGSGVAPYLPYLVDRLRVLYPRDTSLIKEVFETLLSGSLKNDPVSNSRICTLITQLLGEMIAARYELSDPSHDIEHISLRPALMYISQHYMEELTLDMLAKTIHVSKYYFAHLFSETTGLSPYQYIIQYRIKQAKLILSTSRESIVSVASSVGFPTVNRFIYQFNKLVGVTPSTYRDAVIHINDYENAHALIRAESIADLSLDGEWLHGKNALSKK